ncbi:uncharacterized protein LY89DRAFT_678093 [Mollisia scopiformis]|uniref:Uncharacterized protein n=1 Tax=Mollisia scopiformis TaxID=149040 RepID=A0A132B3Y9_MOLSC|nr:uncharacterized protein LY89DRAFT_678093 [Mollisia scopiformis]KUJ07125.1 hypothetical protein LY89DRAFT_678093 [Mollisia scopiformis]
MSHPEDPTSSPTRRRAVEDYYCDHDANYPCPPPPYAPGAEAVTKTPGVDASHPAKTPPLQIRNIVPDTRSQTQFSLQTDSPPQYQSRPPPPYGIVTNSQRTLVEGMCRNKEVLKLKKQQAKQAREVRMETQAQSAQIEAMRKNRAGTETWKLREAIEWEDEKRRIDAEARRASVEAARQERRRGDRIQ